jgi:hypothetical protein
VQIKKIITFTILSFSIAVPFTASHKHNKKLLIVIDPAGDAKKTGRPIADSFERALTLQCAEKIKVELEKKIDIKVIITRSTGDTVAELHSASLANRMNADLFIMLNFYHTDEVKQPLYLYNFSYGNHDIGVYKQGLSLCSFDKAYMINKDLTNDMVQQFAAHLQSESYHNLFTLHGPYAMPCKQLIGVIASGIVLEAGLKTKDAWQLFVQPIVEGILILMQRQTNNE